jgi:hypothetical protein
VLSDFQRNPSADFNDDRDVDADDLAIWQAGFGLTGTAQHNQGDADFDLDVDGADFLLWQRELHTPPVVAAAMAVPEPGMRPWWGLSAIALGCFRRQAGRGWQNC